MAYIPTKIVDHVCNMHNETENLVSPSQGEYKFQSVILISAWNEITQCVFPDELPGFDFKKMKNSLLKPISVLKRWF